MIAKRAATGFPAGSLEPVGEVLPEPPERFPQFPPLRPDDDRDREADRDGDWPAARGDDGSAGPDWFEAGGSDRPWSARSDRLGFAGSDRLVPHLGGDGAGEPYRPTVGGTGRPGGDQQTGARPFFRGVARVPRSAAPEGEDTGELPPSGRGPSPPPARVSRYRWRTLRRGARWTVTGAGFAVICWGLWAVTTRDGSLVNRVLALAVVLATAGLVFGVSRLLGRVVLENTLGRTRRSAWVSHLLTFLLLVAAGVTFLQQTWWAVEAWQWLDARLR